MFRRLAVLLLLAAVAIVAFADGSAPPKRPGQVLHIVDGDTLDVRVGERDETVRIVGIDTPERGACGYEEATRALRRLARSRVRLQRDPTQDRRDRYGRLLAYVQAGGVDVGEALVRAGWADVYVFDDDPFERVDAYRRARAQARAERQGLNTLCP